MKRLVAIPVLFLAAAAARAEPLRLRPPSVAEAMDEIERTLARTEPREQTLVIPERAGQNQVSWYDFRWRRYDMPPPGGGKGGLRLYYYESARPIAERALPAIESAYAWLVDRFHYAPTRVIPYILYSSKREFQTTNVFRVSESVLGVTSPQDLKMSLPYFGDHERFREVSTHEMVHQFTIQKLMDLAGAQGGVSMVGALPLWFVEGIAEYYTKGGVDAETDGFLRDLVWNPDTERHYEIVSFGEDRIRGYIPTYKLGQARVAFVAEVYGEDKIQGFLENAHLLGSGTGGERSFGTLVRRVLNETPDQVDARWRAWLKRRYYAEYLRIRQDFPIVREVEGPDEIEAYAASPDGNVLLVRAIDREEGRARLYLLDPRSPSAAVEVAADNQPGVESLHPIEQRILAISRTHVAFAAQAGPVDALYVRAYRREAAPGRPTRLELGRRRRVELRHPSGLTFIEVADPTFSPDGSEIAFVGLTEEGQKDVFVVPTRGGEVRQLTRDPFAERDLHWSAGGILFASDATEHGRVNLFRLDPATGARVRLTTHPADDRAPQEAPGGGVLFSSLAGRKSDLFLLRNGEVRRLSDFSTGLANPAYAPDGRGIWAQTIFRGRFRLVELPRVAWLDESAWRVEPARGPPLAIPTQAIPPEVPRYDAYSLGNWRAEAGAVYGAGTANAIAGRGAVLFADMLRDRTLYVDLAVYGSFEFTQGLAVFENRAGRIPWALGAFHFVEVQLDRLDPQLEYYQRTFGVEGVLRYPIDRYRRFDLQLTLGAFDRYCLTDTASFLVLVCEGIEVNTPHYSSTADWRRRNGGTSPFLGPSISFGYDTVRYDPLTGPLDGSSAILEAGGYWLPGRNVVNGFARLEAASWLRIVDRANLSLRIGLGTTFAPNEDGLIWARNWWLSAPDNLRQFYYYDLSYLIGLHYYVANLELQFPLSVLVRFLFFDYLEGVAALDFGGVFNRFSAQRDATGALVHPGFWEARTLTGVLGVNMLLGPILLRLHFGHPFDIGGQVTPALFTGTSWVTNFTLRYFFF